MHVPQGGDTGAPSSVALMGMGRLGRSMAALLPRVGVRALPWSRGQPVPEADVHWLTVRDAAIPEVAALLPPDAVALHASGALGPEALGERAERGVLHPLMTFPGPEVALPDLRGVGARVEGTPRATAAARALALALGMRPFALTGDARLYHAAACVASGHLAALFCEAAEVLARAGLPEPDARALLLPLALESVRRAADAGPGAITGPAARGDVATEDGHRAVLTPEERPSYEAGAALVRRLRRERGAALLSGTTPDERS